MGEKMSYKISVNKETCIGCGACTTCDNFEMNEEGKSKPKKEIVEEISCNQDAADACPVQAIKVEKQE